MKKPALTKKQKKVKKALQGRRGFTPSAADIQQVAHLAAGMMLAAELQKGNIISIEINRQNMTGKTTAFEKRMNEYIKNNEKGAGEDDNFLKNWD